MIIIKYILEIIKPNNKKNHFTIIINMIKQKILFQKHLNVDSDKDEEVHGNMKINNDNHNEFQDFI